MFHQIQNWEENQNTTRKKREIHFKQYTISTISLLHTAVRPAVGTARQSLVGLRHEAELGRRLHQPIAVFAHSDDQINELVVTRHRVQLA